jgi:hypothetical protein
MERHINLSDKELDIVIGAGSNARESASYHHWRERPQAPTPAEWRAIGEMLSANYISSHSPSLGSPLK